MCIQSIFSITRTYGDQPCPFFEPKTGIAVKAGQAKAPHKRKKKIRK